ncbi:MAG: hypothetical protein V1644_00060, partial [Candidatus Micrarchaeota archaeon]
MPRPRSLQEVHAANEYFRGLGKRSKWDAPDLMVGLHRAAKRGEIPETNLKHLIPKLEDLHPDERTAALAKASELIAEKPADAFEHLAFTALNQPQNPEISSSRITTVEPPAFVRGTINTIDRPERPLTSPGVHVRLPGTPVLKRRAVIVPEMPNADEPRPYENEITRRLAAEAAPEAPSTPPSPSKVKKFLAAISVLKPPKDAIVIKHNDLHPDIKGRVSSIIRSRNVRGTLTGLIAVIGGVMSLKFPPLAIPFGAAVPVNYKLYTHDVRKDTREVAGQAITSDFLDATKEHRVAEVARTHPIFYVNKKGDLILTPETTGRKLLLKLQRRFGIREVVPGRYRGSLENPIEKIEFPAGTIVTRHRLLPPEIREPARKLAELYRSGKWTYQETDSLYKTIIVADPNNTKQTTIYNTPYLQVKLNEKDTEEEIFYGRVEYVEPEWDTSLGQCLVGETKILSKYRGVPHYKFIKDI